MTTKLEKPVSREVLIPGRGWVNVTLTAEGLTYRNKGARTSYLLPYGVGYARAESLAGDALRATNTKPKKVKRGLLTTGR